MQLSCLELKVTKTLWESWKGKLYGTENSFHVGNYFLEIKLQAMWSNLKGAHLTISKAFFSWSINK